MFISGMLKCALILLYSCEMTWFHLYLRHKLVGPDCVQGCSSNVRESTLNFCEVTFLEEKDLCCVTFILDNWLHNMAIYCVLMYYILLSFTILSHTACCCSELRPFIAQHMIEHNGPLFICWLWVGPLPTSSGFLPWAYGLTDSHAGY